MKNRKNLIAICALALLAGPGILSPLRAQSDDRRVESRLLLVFDTSSAMKKRLPIEEKAVHELFEIALNGHLHPGDSVGVWTFNRELHLGQFPQQEWTYDKVNTLPDELSAFLKSQRYTKETHFEALIPTLNEVVRSSPRLTVVIFCDGDGQVTGIPGADTINAGFKQHHHEMEKARVPFVIVLRSQFDRDMVGRYVGCTMNSAESITLPQFPPFPRPPPPPAPVQALPPPPPPVVPPLIVIGTNIETNLTPAAPAQHQTAPAIPAPAIPLAARTNPIPSPAVRPNVPANQVPPAVSPPPAVPLTNTNSMSPPVAPIAPTNPPVLPPQAAAPPIPPTGAATTVRPEKPMAGRKVVLAATGLLVVCVAVVYLIFRRSRSHDSASLITESLRKR